MTLKIRKAKFNFWINLISLLPVSLLAFTGLLIQLNYHMKRYNDSCAVWGLDRADWLILHKACAVISIITILLHLYLHWNWLKMAFTKRRLKNGTRVKKNSLWLSIIFLLATITSIISWFFIEDKLQAKHVIEIHDKLGIVLSILIIVHLIQHFSWIKRLFKKDTYRN
ncbi:MAG: DUF4405 domain-containing protein [Bacteroidales bacterium]|jgi:hypothetical protein|nr:DUF4405 domain-containing protein [Bacteroidales bacterium]